MKQILVLVLVLMVSGCASKKKVAELQTIKKTPTYKSAEELFKNEQCNKQVGRLNEDQVLLLKPNFTVLNEASDIFCIQKLKKGFKFLKVSSGLEAISDTKNPVPDKKYLATAFDLVVYDKKFNKIKLPKPVYRSPSTNEFLSFYDFSKEKKFPAYVAILFRRENREEVIFSRDLLPSENALIDHSATAAAAGMAMGGFASGSTASLSQPKVSTKYSVYARNPQELKAEWVREIPKEVQHH